MVACAKLKPDFPVQPSLITFGDGFGGQQLF
jgi:hypothetical protein